MTVCMRLPRRPRTLLGSSWASVKRMLVPMAKAVRSLLRYCGMGQRKGSGLGLSMRRERRPECQLDSAFAEVSSTSPKLVTRYSVCNMTVQWRMAKSSFGNRKCKRPHERFSPARNLPFVRIFEGGRLMLHVERRRGQALVAALQAQGARSIRREHCLP